MSGSVIKWNSLIVTVHWLSNGCSCGMYGIYTYINVCVCIYMYMCIQVNVFFFDICVYIYMYHGSYVVCCSLRFIHRGCIYNI